MKNILILLLFLAACSDKNSDPNLIIKAELDGKDWIKCAKKGFGKGNETLGKIYIDNSGITGDCNKIFLNLSLGVKKDLTANTISFQGLPFVVGLYYLSDSKINEIIDCSTFKFVKTEFVFFSEDQGLAPYDLNLKENNFIEIIKIDKINKTIEGKFEVNLNYSEAWAKSEYYKPTINLKNGYFKIPYTFDF
jgi:hypothetical protein